MYRSHILKPLMAAALLPPLPSFVAGEDIDLGFKISSGTYTVMVRLPYIGERSLTFDTGASFTVLDKQDVSEIPNVIAHSSTVRLLLPYEGKAVPATLVTIPWMRIGNCVLPDREVVVADLPENRHGALGMNDLEELAPFTFVGNGGLQFQCPARLVASE